MLLSGGLYIYIYIYIYCACEHSCAPTLIVRYVYSRASKNGSQSLEEFYALHNTVFSVVSPFISTHLIKKRGGGHLNIYIYIYIYIERERERERDFNHITYILIF